MQELVEQVVSRIAQGETVAFCVIVGARGSTPQARGAAMLVTAAGNSVGTLGGGCVEAEVRVRAQKLILEKKSRLLSFKLDQDYGWDDGLVCGGMMDIAVAVVDSKASARPFVQMLNDLADDKPANLHFSVENDQAATVQFDLPIPPSPKLLIAGAGHVGQALANLAHRIGFRITVIDDRADLLTAERFPNAKRITGDIESELLQLPVDENTYGVIVTRGHKHDAQALRAAIGREWKYLGMIGSKRKIRQILAGLHEQGISRERLAIVHAPIGLEIGAVSAEEIAVSIAAELIAVRRDREGIAAPPMKMGDEELDRYLNRPIVPRHGP